MHCHSFGWGKPPRKAPFFLRERESLWIWGWHWMCVSFFNIPLSHCLWNMSPWLGNRWGCHGATPIAGWYPHGLNTSINSRTAGLHPFGNDPWKSIDWDQTLQKTTRHWSKKLDEILVKKWNKVCTTMSLCAIHKSQNWGPVCAKHRGVRPCQNLVTCFCKCFSRR